MRHADRAQLQLQPLRIHLRQFQQVFRQPRQSPRMLQDDPQKPVAVLRVVHGSRKQRFRKSLDRRQRRAELMRYVGHEVSPDSFQFP